MGIYTNDQGKVAHKSSQFYASVEDVQRDKVSGDVRQYGFMRRKDDSKLLDELSRRTVETHKRIDPISALPRDTQPEEVSISGDNNDSDKN